MACELQHKKYRKVDMVNDMLIFYQPLVSPTAVELELRDENSVILGRSLAVEKVFERVLPRVKLLYTCFKTWL